MLKKSPVFGVVAAAVLATTSLISAPVQAQMWMMDRSSGPGMMGQGYGPGMRGWGRAMMGGCGPMAWSEDGPVATFTQGRIAFLKAELAITDDQSAVWNAYADALRNNFESMKGMWQTMKAAFDAKTPPERLDAHIAAMSVRLKAMQDIKPALDKLYAVLGDAQKKKADEILTGMGCMM